MGFGDGAEEQVLVLGEWSGLVGASGFFAAAAAAAAVIFLEPFVSAKKPDEVGDG